MSQDSPGKYVGTLQKIEPVRKVGLKNSPCVAFVFSVYAQLANAGKENECWNTFDQPFTRTCSLFLTEGAIEYTIKKLEKMGWTGESFGTISKDQFPAESFDQSILICQNKDNRIEWQLEEWIGGDGFSGEECSTEEVARLDSLLLNHRRNTPSAAPTPPKA